MTPAVPPESGPDGSPADEPVEILGPDGEVIDIVPRHRMRSGGLAHRSTFVITVLAPPPGGVSPDAGLSGRVQHWLGSLSWPSVGPSAASDGSPTLAPSALRPQTPLGSETLVVVHRRADWKDVYPGYWDLAFGGVCTAGEPWLESAERELAEEAGLAAVVFPIAAGRYVDDRAETFGAVFLAYAEREPEPADGEVVALDRVSLGDLATWVEDRPVCPDSLALVVPAVSSLLDRSDPPM